MKDRQQPMASRSGAAPDEAELLRVRGLRLDLVVDHGIHRTVDDVSFSVAAGETLCLVGESGCGKTLTALALSRLAPEPPVRYVGGSILLQERNVLQMSPAELRAIRGGVVGYIFQDPGTCLNPVFRVGAQIKETLKLHRPEAANDGEVIRWLKLVGISAPEERARSYPHQLSGGMQQRVMIAMALAAQPKLLIADEPTTALDVTVQAQIMDLLRELRQRLNMSMVLITHNLHLARGLADRIAVMYAGQIVETGPAAAVMEGASHPYTQALLRALPTLGQSQPRLATIPGQVPELGHFPTGCRFHPRCAHARRDCAHRVPELLTTALGREVRCHYWNAGPPGSDEALNLDRSTAGTAP